jgi:UDP-glucose 4-epimerase
VLVTGSSGTIGTRLCERLLDSPEYEVVGVDWLPNKWSAAVQEITVLTDLRDPEAIARLPTDFDVVIHLAANARVYDLVLEPGKARDNILTVYNILEFCRQNGIPRFEFASSREVYGNSGRVTHDEGHVEVDLCESPYSASKLAGEALVRSYQQCYGLEFIIFRFSNVYGMYDDSDRVVPIFIRLTKAGEDLTVFGKDKLLDFTYIDDAVDGIVLSLEHFDQARNEAINLACGEGTTIEKVALEIRERLGAGNRIEMGEVRTGEVVQYIADIGKARKILRYDPKVPFAQGIELAVQWYDEHLSG